jgi:hypothetical protein
MVLDGYRAGLRLGREQPGWIPAVRASLVLARRAAKDSNNLGHEFAGAWVLDELQRRVSKDAWFPNLRTLVSYGVLEKSGESTRGGQRAYYRMPDPDGVSRALSDLGHPEWPAN